MGNSQKKEKELREFINLRDSMFLARSGYYIKFGTYSHYIYIQNICRAECINELMENFPKFVDEFYIELVMKYVAYSVLQFKPKELVIVRKLLGLVIHGYFCRIEQLTHICNKLENDPESVSFNYIGQCINRKNV